MKYDVDSDSDTEVQNKKSKYIKLVSRDGFEYIILRELALISPTLSSMLNFEFKESKLNKIELKEIDGVLLSRIVEYLYYHNKYKDSDQVPDFEVPTELALEMLVAADFLDI